MSEFRVRQPWDDDTLVKWFRRGMFGGSAMSMLKHVEEKLERRWTKEEIKEFVSVQKRLMKAKGGVFGKVMEIGIDWMKHHPNPRFDHQHEWFNWETHEARVEESVRAFNANKNGGASSNSGERWGSSKRLVSAPGVPKRPANRILTNDAMELIPLRSRSNAPTFNMPFRPRKDVQEMKKVVQTATETSAPVRKAVQAASGNSAPVRKGVLQDIDDSVSNLREAISQTNVSEVPKTPIRRPSTSISTRAAWFKAVRQQLDTPRNRPPQNPDNLTSKKKQVEHEGKQWEKDLFGSSPPSRELKAPAPMQEAKRTGWSRYRQRSPVGHPSRNPLKSAKNSRSPTPEPKSRKGPKPTTNDKHSSGIGTTTGTTVVGSNSPKGGSSTLRDQQPEPAASRRLPTARKSRPPLPHVRKSWSPPPRTRKSRPSSPHGNRAESQW